VRRYLAIFGAILALFLLLFLAIEALGVPLLDDPTPWLAQGGLLAALLGVGLLLVDVVLPVPSNVVMVAHGALFGVALGTLLSLVGSLGAALIAFAIGRRGERLIGRLVSPAERTQADRLLDQWGTLAIVVTRPVPLIAETVAVLAGASSLGWRRMTVAALAGSLPACLLYAWVGATSATLEAGALAFALVLLLAAAIGLTGRWRVQRSTLNVQRRLSSSLNAER
jgi:uncharacterized membrane protein YdjX (TVP38/TMEM64 family)